MKDIHTLIAAGAVVVLTIAALPGEAARTKPTYPLQSVREPGDTDRVVGLLEVSGDLTEAVDGKVQRIKMGVRCEFGYDEKTLEVPAGSATCWRSVRYYDKLDATIKVDDGAVEPALRPQRRLIGVEVQLPGTTLFSPNGTLTREELDLMDVAANSLLLDLLLPEKAVAIGDTWKHPQELMVALLGLDAVSRSDVQSVLKEVTDTVARIELSGRVEGASGGVSTVIELKGKYRFSLKSKRIDWLGLLIKEQRDIGHVERGVDAVARLQVQISPQGDSPRLSDADLQNLPLKPTADLSKLTYTSPQGGWELTCDRCWNAIGDNRELSILRKVDRGELIAQCNVSALPKLSPGKQLTLAEFQDDVKKALGKSFGEFVTAAQSANDVDYRVFRVVVRGEVSELPICWSYYLVADEQGRQVALAFTVEEALLQRFGNADEELVRSVRFLEPKLASGAKPDSSQGAVRK